MNAENFKLIIETLSAAGENAYAFGVWYLLTHLVPYFLGFAFGVIVVFMLRKAISYAMSNDKEGIDMICHQLGITTSERLLIDKASDILKEIKKLKDKQ